MQLATYTLASDVLRDRDKAGKVFGSLNSRTIGDFMDAFNAIAQQVNSFLSLQPKYEPSVRCCWNGAARSGVSLRFDLGWR